MDAWQGLDFLVIDSACELLPHPTKGTGCPSLSVCVAHCRGCKVVE